MSGASPQTPGVVTGPFPGCQQAPAGGTPGEVSYHIPPSGTDANGCPTGGSELGVDEINGIEQAINCILTNNGLDPLPVDCLCADPCMLLMKLKEIFATCNIPLATQADCDSLDPDLARAPVCVDGETKLYPISCLSTGEFDQLCSDGYAIGSIVRIPDGLNTTHTVGDDVSATINAYFGSTGTWIALDQCTASGTEGDCSMTAQKDSCD